MRHVVFAGFQQKHDLPRYYAAADVFVFPTLGDPFGMVIGEAMSCGLPVISSASVGEIRSRVRDGENGFIVPPGDARALARRMEQLAGDPSLVSRMGAVSADRIRPFTAEGWAADFEAGIAQLLATPPAARSRS